MNIPIYRAKKLDSDEYAISSTIIKNKMWTDGKGYHDVFYILEDENVSILKRFPVYYPDVVEIDPSTLSVHFPETNIENLFFGLDNGLGASIIEAVFIDDISPFKGIAMHSQYGYVFFDKNNDWVHINKLKDIKVIGIQK